MQRTLKGKKVGIIGFGNIGQAVAKRCAAFEMEVGIFDIIPELKEKARELGYTTYSSVEDLIKNVRFITLHVPANTHTENLINENTIKLMNENTIIINTGRGQLINETALINALEEKKIAGAALDVFKEEPLNNRELYGIYDNLILTPHIGSSTEETQTSAAITIAEKICKYLEDQF